MTLNMILSVEANEYIDESLELKTSLVATPHIYHTLRFNGYTIVDSNLSLCIITPMDVNIPP
jgi:hypothetical protein